MQSEEDEIKGHLQQTLTNVITDKIANRTSLIYDICSKAKVKKNWKKHNMMMLKIYDSLKLNNCKNAINYLFDKMPEIIAMHLVKEAIMKNETKLCIIGKAIESGINVYIYTYAVKSDTDISKYESGNKLWILGVKDKTNHYIDNSIIIIDSSASI